MSISFIFYFLGTSPNQNYVKNHDVQDLGLSASAKVDDVINGSHVVISGAHIVICASVLVTILTAVVTASSHYMF